MFFRPKFCANCGEKIERADWGLFTSRRFCQICESEFKGHDLIPRAVVGLGVLAGVFGFGSYLKSGTAVDNRIAKMQQTSLPAPLRQPADERQPAVNSATQGPATSGRTSQSKTLVAAPAPSIQPSAKPEVQESTYFCGAETKKGKPCLRRVKGNTRCFQHVGMPSMLPTEKLKIN